MGSWWWMEPWFLYFNSQYSSVIHGLIESLTILWMFRFDFIYYVLRAYVMLISLINSWFNSQSQTNGLCCWPLRQSAWFNSIATIIHSQEWRDAFTGRWVGMGWFFVLAHKVVYLTISKVSLIYHHILYRADIGTLGLRKIYQRI